MRGFIRKSWSILYRPVYPLCDKLGRVSQGASCRCITDSTRTSSHVRKVTKAEALDWTIILPFSHLGGLHGAQWSRSSDLKRIMEDLVTTAEFAKRRCDAHGRCTTSRSLVFASTKI